MSIDRADVYMDNVEHVQTWEEAAAHIALFRLWASERDLLRIPIPAEQRRRPFHEFLRDFANDDPLKLTEDELVSEGRVFVSEWYDEFAAQFAPDDLARPPAHRRSSRTQSVYHDGEAGWRATFEWLDSTLRTFRRRRGEPAHGLPPRDALASSMRALLRRAGEPYDDEGLSRCVSELPSLVRDALEAPPAREWERFTTPLGFEPTVDPDDPSKFAFMRFVRPCDSPEFKDYGAREVTLRDIHVLVGDEDVTFELDVHDRLELFGEASCVQWLLANLGPARERLPEAAWAALFRSCFFVRVGAAASESEDVYPEGSLLSPRDFRAHAEACLNAGSYPPAGRWTYISVAYADFYSRPWSERTQGE